MDTCDSSNFMDAPESLSICEFRDPTQRNLLDDFETPLKAVKNKHHMNVYLRVRPFTQHELETSENKKCMEVVNSNCLLANAPPTSNTYKNSQHGCGKQTHKFTFSHIFPAQTTQSEFFEKTVQEKVKNFIEGQNCLVFTYGVTNSGKTYTIQGEPKDAGILPRSLDVIFNSIQSRQLEEPCARPSMFCDAVKLSAKSTEKELQIKEDVLKLAAEQDSDLDSLLGSSTSSRPSDLSTMSEDSIMTSDTTNLGPEPTQEEFAKLFEDAREREREQSCVNVDSQGDIRYSVWVSYAELYNEMIYDLLESVPKKKNSRRPTLNLRQDQKANPYIKDLKEICVNSADEAYKILTIGKQNLHIACTKLNHNSSRSHCIFTIKILRFVDKQDPNMARISMLSFCDLAGSERYSKTQAEGDRIKEAGNINTSLLALGRCITVLRHNQAHRDNIKIVPFRDSKLTRLFQSFFCGRGKACMIVNINQCAATFDETLHALKYSAVAKQVMVTQDTKEPAPKQPRPKRMVSLAFAPTPAGGKATRHTIAWASPGQMAAIEDEGAAMQIPSDDSLDDTLEEDTREQELLETISKLRVELIEEKKHVAEQEAQIREEICNEMSQQLIILETEHNEALNDARDLANNRADRKIEMFLQASARKKRKCNFEQDTELNSKLDAKNDEIEDLKAEVKENTEKLKSLKQHLSTVTQERDKLWTENSQFQFDLADLKTQLQESQGKCASQDSGAEPLTAKVELLQNELKSTKANLLQKKEEVVELNEMLSEAGEVFKKNEQQMEDLQSTVESCNRKINDKDTFIGELEKRMKENDATLECSKEALNSKQLELEQLKKKVDIVQPCSECQNKVSEIGKLVSQISDLEDRATRQQSSHEKVEESINDQKQLVTQYEDKLKQLTVEYADLKRQLKDEKHSNDNDKETRTFEVNELQELLASSQETCDNQTRERNQLKNDVCTLMEKVAQLTQEIELKDEQLQTIINGQQNGEDKQNSQRVTELEEQLQSSQEKLEALLNKQSAEDENQETINKKETEKLIDENEQLQTLVNELQGHLDKYTLQVNEQSAELELLRAQSKEHNLAVKNAVKLEEQLQQERKTHRNAINETESLIQQKSVKIEELSTAIDGLEQRMKHADIAAAAADAKIASLTIEGSGKQQQPEGENLPDEIKELKAQVRQFDNAAHEAEYKAQMIERQLRREKNIIEKLLREKEEQLVEASNQMGEMQTKLESSLLNESGWAEQQRDLLEARGQVAELQECLRQSKEQNDGHQSDTGYLKLELEKQCKQVKKLEDVIHELETCLNLSKTREANSCEGTDSLKRKYKELTVELDGKDDVIQKLESTIQDMKASELELIEAKQNEADMRAEQLLDAERMCKELKAEALALNSRLQPLLEMEDNKASTSEYIEQSESKYQQLDEEYHICLENNKLLEDRLSTIQSECDAYKIEIENFNIKITENAETVQQNSVKQETKFKEEIEIFENTIKENEHTITQAEDKIRQLQQTIIEHKETVESSQSQFNMLETQHKETTRLLDDFKSKLAIVEQTIEQEDNEHIHKAEQLTQEVSSLHSQLSASKELECAAQDTVCALKSELEAKSDATVKLDSDIKSLNRELEKDKNLITELQAEVEQQKTTATLNTAEDSELRKQLRSAADLQVQHNRKIDSLEEKLSDSQTQLDDIEREKRQLKTELQAAQKALSDIRHESSESIESHQKEAQRLRLTLEKHESKISLLQTDLESKDSHIETMTNKLHKLMDDSETKQTQYESAVKETKEQDVTITSLKQALELQDTTMEKQEKVIQDKNKHIQVLQKDLSASESKIMQAESDKKNKWYTEKQELNDEVEYLNKQLESSKDMLEKEKQMQKRLCEERDNLNCDLNSYRDRLNKNAQISNDEATELENKLAEKESQISELLVKEKQWLKSESEVAEARRQTADQQNNLHLLRIKFKSLETSNAELSKELETIEQKLAASEQNKKTELENWRNDKDKLVSNLEKILQSKDKEISKLQKSSSSLSIKVNDQDDIITQLTEHLDVASKTRAGKSRNRMTSGGTGEEDIADLKQKFNDLQLEHQRVVKAKDSIIDDLRTTNMQLQSSMSEPSNSGSRPNSEVMQDKASDRISDTPLKVNQPTSTRKTNRRQGKHTSNDENVPKSGRKTGKRATHSSAKKKCVPGVLQASMDHTNVDSAIGDHDVIDLDDISPNEGIVTPAKEVPRRAGKRRLRSTHPEPYLASPDEPKVKETSAQNIVLRQLRTRRK